jgi:polyphenol oxidase
MYHIYGGTLMLSQHKSAIPKIYNLTYVLQLICPRGMATASAACTSFLVPATAVASTPSACPSTLPKKNAGRRRRTVLCRASGGGRGDDVDSRLLWLPRRGVLTGLSGVAAGFVGYPDLASIALEANPVESCRRGEKVTDKLVECSDPNRGFPCPPASRIPIVDFTPERTVTRIRRPAHLLDPEYQAKYKEAIGKMRALDKSNPLSFAAQAAVHESYCDGHYRLDPTEKNRPFDVHFSWIFAPWHRMYIYFYERALGDLIGDDTFALPYWSWDTPAGMGIPAVFKGVSTAENPLFDPYRNMDNKDALIDLDYLKTPKRPTIPFKPPPESDAAARQAYDDAVRTNLSTIYIQVINQGVYIHRFVWKWLALDFVWPCLYVCSKSVTARGPVRTSARSCAARRAPG